MLPCPAGAVNNKNALKK